MQLNLAWLTMKELLETDDFNSGQSRLLVKVIPAKIYSITTKTIYVRDVDEDGKHNDEFAEYKITNDHDLKMVVQTGNGLTSLTDPKRVIVSFIAIVDKEKYQVHGRVHFDFAGYHKQKANAMETLITPWNVKK